MPTLTELTRRQPVPTRLLNAKVPASLITRLTTLAHKLRATRTEVVVALLNEGLDTLEARLRRT